MCGLACGVSTAVAGAVLVAATCIVSFGFVPGIVENIIVNEVVLMNDTIQMERFEEVPFPLNLSVRIWTISNGDAILTGGVPEMRELGPYIYKCYQRRVVDKLEGDNVTYHKLDRLEFDPIGSYPYTEDDLVTVVNVPYHAILQVAEQMFPLLMPILSTGLNGVFGEFNRPIIEVRVRDLLFDGIAVCQNPGLIGAVVCSQVREISANANNLVAQEDGSLIFSLLSYKDGIPSGEYVAHRGLDTHENLGIIQTFRELEFLKYWTEEPNTCNKILGTDSGIYPPFVDRELPIFALNTDICRSVELRYQYDLEFKDIPAARFAMNEWFLDNDEGCFCLNVTRGINREDGCLLRGAIELYSCVGAFMVLSYPHFLHADSRYRNGVIGMNPIEEEHRIFLDLEPNTGTVIRGAKRAQFNIFVRPIAGIAATQNLRTTLAPVVWVEEGMSLPDEFADELKTRLLASLRLLDILIPVVIAVSCVILLLGVLIVVKVKMQKPGVMTKIS